MSKRYKIHLYTLVINGQCNIQEIAADEINDLTADAVTQHMKIMLHDTGVVVKHAKGLNDSQYYDFSDEDGNTYYFQIVDTGESIESVLKKVKL